jgi:uncharacterized protein (DUF1800 family)
MANPRDPLIEHLLRRAGFGARPDELDTYRAESYTGAVTRLLEYDRIPDDVDSKIGTPGYVQVTSAARTVFAPASTIGDARQRWLFRMVHTNRPLQEKMTLFWHNHFATGYTKIAGQTNTAEATRYMAAKASEDPGQVRGQIEMLRDNALGNFRDILVNIAKDTAMLFWLDGNQNTRPPAGEFRPRDHGTVHHGRRQLHRADVYAAARCSPAGTCRGPGPPADPSTTSS